MTRETQLELVKGLTGKLVDVLVSKSGDYATEDVLSNFKRLAGAAEALNLDVKTPGGYALFMVLLKIDRINNLLTSGKTPNNESIDDSFIDGLNYLLLNYCIVKEEQETKSNEELFANLSIIPNRESPEFIVGNMGVKTRF